MLGTDMRPSSAISFDSGLDRGVPWGRDLITFMTSAAGYMMRTLQKPRKNKPSKRQVNHRRFLHNMIQRKFTEIEAANHQLASALFSVDAGSQRQSEEQSNHKHESEKKMKKGEAETKQQDENKNTRSLDSFMTNLNGSSLVKLNGIAQWNNLDNGKINQIREDRLEEEHSNEKPPEITDLTGERQQIPWASVELSESTLITNIILEDTVCTSLEGIEKITDYAHVQIPNSRDSEQQQQYPGLTLFDLSPTSPVSPLSLHSCDFEVQTHSDLDHTSQIQHIAESLQTDSMENLELLDSEEYLQDIDQMDMAAVWDIHNEKGLGCFQDNLPFSNPSHTDIVMDRQATFGDGDICGGLHQITTMLENPEKDINVENELKSNFAYSLEHCGPVGYRNQSKPTRATVDCYLNQPEISTAFQNSGTVCERELEHHLTDQSQSKTWEQHLSYYHHVPSKLNDSYHTLSDKEKKIINSGPILNLNSDLSDPGNPLFMSIADCYDFDTPLQANSNCLRDTWFFSNHKVNQSIPSFEGVAQSFPAPYQNSHLHSVSTPTLNDDWLLSNITPEVDFRSMAD